MDVREFQEGLKYVTKSINQIAGQHVLAATGLIYDSNYDGLNTLYNLLTKELEYLVDGQACFCNEEYRVMSDCSY